MPIFEYRGLHPSGKNIRGVVEAESAKSARQKLKKQNVIVTHISEKSASKPSASSGIPFVSSRVGVKETALMTRQLASLVRANIPLVEALNALVEQTEKESLKIILSKVRDDVNEGISLGKAIAAHPKVFDNIFVNMVEAGEASGTLNLVLLKLADLKEAQMRLRNKIVSGMTYPVLMMLVAVGLMIGIFTFVIPKLMKIFESMNKEIPTVTKVLMAISDIMVNWWFLILAGFFVASWMFRRWSTSPKGRPKWDAMKLRFPIFGPLFRMIAITRFASTLSTLLGTGVPIVTSMTIARNLVGNTVIAKAIDEAKENITEGQSIAVPLKRSGEFPPVVIHMIAIGEKTGELPDMLRNVSEGFEEQVNARIDGLASLLEPAMIIGMGGAVAFIVLSVFVPLMEVSNLQ